MHGRVLDADGRPIPDALVEIWQANAAGRYRHHVDNWPAPHDPNFTGGGRTVTRADGSYEFTTIKPGAYPWRNNPNAWRPAHIHFSLFGRAFVQRLVTQMYFPGDPLFFQDPIFNSVRDEKARQSVDLDLRPRIDERRVGAGVSVRHRAARPRRHPVRAAAMIGLTPSQTVGPFLHIGLSWPDGENVVPEATPGAVVITGCLYDGNGDAVVDGLIETWQADANGRFTHPDDPRGTADPEPAGFRGLGRSATSDAGRYRIVTVKPGRVTRAGRASRSAAHRRLGVRARLARSRRHPHLLSGRSRSQRGRPGALRDRRRSVCARH